MSINDLRELSISELETKVSELKKELMESRFSLATSQIEDTSIFKKIKKQIAQANTVLNQKKREDMMKADNNE
ncbi:50S ribosomal protein L29 [Candidatus Actinomarina sp.]|jgi:large subunit ribosomal protein L29|nr:50S ribosomal protein L29 [Actinomycetota bacterium]MDA7543383.1 50S ribosomal protein L29 [Acidimicrobiia bacterium]MDA7724955.1 50S ribosomal protein L29 [Acidimicrobiaceae bacterium]MDA8710510.1 50S ribosomal protein L29 [Candidatus Actinomarina sp.]MBT3873493.1 50S ribosomal protein L29 [Actinomycetota bacterium]|tara:strand:+ start:13692 stop:13910 length:219 start_codon:yes stop_codon:yes gene_type:complete